MGKITPIRHNLWVVFFQKVYAAETGTKLFIFIKILEVVKNLKTCGISHFKNLFTLQPTKKKRETIFFQCRCPSWFGLCQKHSKKKNLGFTSWSVGMFF